MVEWYERPGAQTVIALVAIVAVLWATHSVLPAHWALRYGSYLVAFTIYMAWFVEVVVAALRE